MCFSAISFVSIFHTYPGFICKLNSFSRRTRISSLSNHPRHSPLIYNSHVPADTPSSELPLQVAPTHAEPGRRSPAQQNTRLVSSRLQPTASPAVSSVQRARGESTRAEGRLRGEFPVTFLSFHKPAAAAASRLHSDCSAGNNCRNCAIHAARRPPLAARRPTLPPLPPTATAAAEAVSEAMGGRVC